MCDCEVISDTLPETKVFFTIGIQLRVGFTVVENHLNSQLTSVSIAFVGRCHEETLELTSVIEVTSLQSVFLMMLLIQSRF